MATMPLSTAGLLAPDASPWRSVPDETGGPLWPVHPTAEAVARVQRPLFGEDVMAPTPGPSRTLSRRLRLVLWGLAAAALAGVLIRVLRGVHSDFPLHYAFGRRFLEGTFIYAGDLHVPYPLFWALFWAPWTLLSLEAARVVAFVVLATGSLTVFCVVLVRVGRRIVPSPRDRVTLALVVALLLVVVALLAWHRRLRAADR